MSTQNVSQAGAVQGQARLAETVYGLPEPKLEVHESFPLWATRFKELHTGSGPNHLTSKSVNQPASGGQVGRKRKRVSPRRKATYEN